ncbi:phage_P_loop, phage nucleotide-binding protein [uncultured Caudovirales phage]|uniref:Phage_P_loop, phage nucleotide-binding protein n=1 Tax=uncultured Caudovirales phage TaxID=2100421 RepID=A0A6J5RTZ9_9CAUD|nr:phage_P_loop, phage nucleotide-binding protein [uncultured Caudovirales phage]
MALKVIDKPTESVTMNVVLYGPPKTGKTIAAASSPKQVLYVNCDLPNATRLAHKMNDGITEVQFEGLQTLIDVVVELKNSDTYKTVVVDPIGELYRRLLDEASNNAIRPTLPQRGDVAVHIERFCRAICELDVNAIIVAHEIADKDESLGSMVYLPFCGTSNPKLAQKLMGMVDVVGYTGVVENEDGTKQFVAQLHPAGGRRGGDRFDVLGDVRTTDLSEWYSLIDETNAAEAAEQE